MKATNAIFAPARIRSLREGNVNLSTREGGPHVNSTELLKLVHFGTPQISPGPNACSLLFTCLYWYAGGLPSFERPSCLQDFHSRLNTIMNNSRSKDMLTLHHCHELFSGEIPWRVRVHQTHSDPVFNRLVGWQ